VLVRVLMMVTEAVPVLVAVIGSVALLPTATSPKVSVAVFKVRSPIDAGCRLEGVPALKP
jgi:hypothetical protein